MIEFALVSGVKWEIGTFACEGKGRIIFDEEGLCGGGRGAHFFSNLKRKGSHFFPEFNIEYIYIFKKVCNIRNQSASCTTEPLFISLSNTDLQRFCLIHI